MEKLEARSSLAAAVAPAALARYLRSLGFERDKSWGPYLARYRRIDGAAHADLIVPEDADIDDFGLRMAESLAKLAHLIGLHFEQVIRAIDMAGFDVLRIRTFPSESTTSMEFDDAIDLLRNGFELVESSAVIVTSGPTREIRGRRPDVVRDYLDTIRMGQTEVGSFVLTLLLPIETPGGNYGLPEELAAGFGRKVSTRFASILTAVDHLASDQSQIALEEAVQQGLSANFSDALATMLRVAGDLSLNVATSDHELRRKKSPVVRFRGSDRPVFADIASQLAVPKIRKSTTIAGTVTAIREPSIRKPGSVNLSTEVEGEVHTVTLTFDRDDRPKVIRAFERKSEVHLQVSGILTRSGPKYILEKAHTFKTPKIGSLT